MWSLVFILWNLREQKTPRSCGRLFLCSRILRIYYYPSLFLSHTHTSKGSTQQHLFGGSLTILGEIRMAVQPCHWSPFSCAWSLGAGCCSSVRKSMRLRKNCNDGHWAAGISCSISPPNCLATVFQGLSFEIKSLVDWRLRFGEMELVPFDKTAEKWALSSTPFVPSLPFLHPLLLSLLLFLSLSLSHWPPPQPFPTRMIMLLSTAWCIQFTRLFSVISVNWILSITYRCFHICIKVRVVKSVKLQFRQCHSNKYTGLFLCLSPSPCSPEVGIYGFCLNFNRSVFLGCAGSHIHVNMNMKITGWLSDMGCVTMRGWVCVNLFNNLCIRTFDYMCVCVSVHMVTFMAGLWHRQYVGITILCSGSQ